jgi:hypothetical protein
MFASVPPIARVPRWGETIGETGETDCMAGGCSGYGEQPSGPKLKGYTPRSEQSQIAGSTTFYKALIRPVMGYPFPTWEPGSMQRTLIS